MDPVVQPVNQSELLSRVRELRAAGLSPKQVARELGMKPAQVAPLLRQVAGSHRGPAEQRSLGEPGEREVVGCWINPGWSAGLGLDQAPPEWVTADPEGQSVGDTLSGGLAGVMVARADRSSRVTVCGWLVVGGQAGDGGQVLDLGVGAVLEDRFGQGPVHAGYGEQVGHRGGVQVEAARPRLGPELVQD